MELPAGHAVGPYDIVAPLGRGGMGTVYLARDRRLGRHVALKFLHAGQGAADSYARLLREAQAASTLNHPNICQIYDVGSEGAASWIAMEHIEGPPLSTSIPSSGLPTDDAVRIVKAVAHALAHAHERGVIHRDLKPSNIVFDGDGQPKILDFGISSRSPEAIASDITQTGATALGASVQGSVPYMAPEILRGQLPDQRSDLWSLGVVFHELLTGRLPFTGTPIAIMAAVLEGRVPPLPASVPASLAKIVRRLLATMPSDRYGGAKEVAAALDVVTAEARGRTRRSPAPVIVLLALVLAGGGYFLWSQLKARPLTLANQLLVSTSDTSHRAPSFSPDATLAAVVVPDAAGIAQVHVVDLVQKRSMQITHASAAASRPRWSPRGDQIVYGVDGQGIWSVSPVGGEARRILESGFNPNFSRDGSRLVFETRNGIWTADADGSHSESVKGAPPLYYPIARGPALSPDGRDIAFFHARTGPNGDIWILPAAGGTARQLTSDLREGGWPVWTRDGRSIIYSSARAGSRTLWQVPAKGGDPVPLTIGTGEDDEPDISADGARLAYSNVRNTWDLRRMDLATKMEHSLLRRNTEMLFPRFAPDGKRIVFFGRADAAVAIFTMNADGSSLRQVTSGRELNHQPRWSHDGEQIYFFQVSPEESFRRISALGGASTQGPFMGVDDRQRSSSGSHGSIPRLPAGPRTGRATQYARTHRRAHARDRRRTRMAGTAYASDRVVPRRHLHRRLATPGHRGGLHGERRPVPQSHCRVQPPVAGRRPSLPHAPRRSVQAPGALVGRSRRQ